MAVSLISSGVQFPDSTIQTTAATASAAPGLILISTTTSAGGASTFDITTGFSSTYDDYLIIGENITLGNRVNAAAYMQIYAGGTLQTGFNYNRVNLYGIGSPGVIRGVNTSVPTFVDFYDTSMGSCQITLTNVNSTSSRTQGLAIFGTNDNSTVSGINVSVISFNYNTASVLTGIRLFWDSGFATFPAGAVLKLYGIKK